MMHGWLGKILRVDLDKGRLREEALDPKVARDYIGGRGLGIYYLNKEVDPKCDPFAPENILIMATGPLTGTGAPTGSRYMVMTKSPLTGAITCSNSGGTFPVVLKRSGFDAVVFSGRAKEPVYLWIDNGKAEPPQCQPLVGENHTRNKRPGACRNSCESESGLYRAGWRKARFICFYHER